MIDIVMPEDAKTERQEKEKIKNVREHVWRSKKTAEGFIVVATTGDCSIGYCGWTTRDYFPTA